MLLLGLAYASTIFLPYALNDENWIIRASHWWARFDVRQGRPLFSIAIFLTSQLRNVVGAAVIPVLRIGAIVGLAAAMAMVATWIEWWRFDRARAWLIVLVVASLPPFQIYVTDATWIVIPFTASVAAVLLVCAAYHRSDRSLRLPSYVCAAAMWLCALAFYQPAILIAIGLLIVPVLTADVRDAASIRSVTTFAIFVTAFVASITLMYYVAWLILWRMLESANAPAYYSPLAVNAHALSRLKYFFSDRLLQMLNLWHVDALRPTMSAWLVGLTALLGSAVDLVRAVRAGDPPAGVRRWAVKYALATGILIASDAIPLLASAPVPSYVTAPALAFVVVFWAVHGVHEVARCSPVALRAFTASLVALAVFGLFMAEYTTLTYFAVPLSLEYGLVRGEVIEYVRTHPTVHRIHVVGRKVPLLNHGLHEFGWSNATFDVYTRDMVKNVLDEIGAAADVDVTVSETLATALPSVEPPSADTALVIDLSRIHIAR